MGWQGILIGFGNCCCWCCWCCCCCCCCTIDRSKIMPISLSLKLNICLCPKVIKFRKSRHISLGLNEISPKKIHLNFNLTTFKVFMIWIKVKLFLRIFATFSFRTILSICDFKSMKSRVYELQKIFKLNFQQFSLLKNKWSI